MAKLWAIELRSGGRHERSLPPPHNADWWASIRLKKNEDLDDGVGVGMLVEDDYMRFISYEMKRFTVSPGFTERFCETRQSPAG